MLLTAVIFLIILTSLVLIHELGHYWVARWIGVHVEEFGIGLPPKIMGKKFGSTEYSLNWLPIGGFVRLAGEDADPAATGKPKPKGDVSHYFWARSKKERAAILLAGVFMNFALAVGITAGLLTTGVNEPTGRVHVERVIPGSPAESAGIKPQDVILGMTESDHPNMINKVVVPGDLIRFAQDNKGELITLRVLRGDDIVILSMTPRVEVPKGEGPLGIAISDLELKKYSWTEAPGKALVINLTRARDMFTSLGSVLYRLATLQSPGADVAGPIGIAQVTGEAVKFGWKAVFEFASILSLNLAVLNVLPIPALDGGRLAFVFLEKLRRKKVAPAFEQSAHQIGMIILLALIVLVSINDILRLVRG